MLKTDAAHILARHILTEAKERGITNISDRFAHDVIAEATHPAMADTRWAHVHQAAISAPAFTRVRAAARDIIAAHRILAAAR